MGKSRGQAARGRRRERGREGEGERERGGDGEEARGRGRGGGGGEGAYIQMDIQPTLAEVRDCWLLSKPCLHPYLWGGGGVAKRVG